VGENAVALSTDTGIGFFSTKTGTEVTTGETAIVGTASGVYAVAPAWTIQLYAGPSSGGFWSAQTSELLVLPQGRTDLVAVAWSGDKTPPSNRRLLAGHSLDAARRAFGVARLPISGDAAGVAVLTASSLSVYHDGYFQRIAPPKDVADQPPSISALASHGLDAYLLAADGVYAVTESDFRTFPGKVNDLLTDTASGVTYVATTKSLKVIFHERAGEGPQDFSPTIATHLALDREGRLVADSGSTIVRFDKGTSTVRELFKVDPTVPKSVCPARQVRRLLVASDGTIWVAAGPSVFHWSEGSDVREYSMFLDGHLFPARSKAIANIIETVDGHIRVIASDDRPDVYEGMILEGGVLEWSGSEFKRLDISRSTAAWFLTSYTPIGDRTAIAGSAVGFAADRNGRLSSFTERNDPTYAQLAKGPRPLWLGTRGAAIGDLWLFGSAAGVVGYRNGQWFWPERINLLLPDPQLVMFGSRKVNAIETDTRGRVYAGTDRGLLVYESGSEEPSGFLASNLMHREAFEALEQSKLRREAAILLKLLDEKSLLGQQVRDALASAKTLRERDTVQRPAPNAFDPRQAAALRQRQAEDRTNRELLLKFEREHVALYQLLELKPLDLAALAQNFAPGEIVLQYLPTDQELRIHVVSKDGDEVKIVPVSQRELYERVRRAATLLGAGAGRTTSRGLASPAGNGRPLADVFDDLEWLYRRLLEPVEKRLEGSQHVYIAPVGPLAYVPFAALIRSSEPKIEFAAERYRFGYLPTMYFLDLILRGRASSPQHDSSRRQALILADPDPDGPQKLPGARVEASAIQSVIHSTLPPLLGKDASYENLVRYAPGTRIVHLASHGVLDGRNIEASYLLLSGGRRLSMADAMTLQLRDADLVVLSACETGVGVDGLEYATLTRSFAQAGARAIIATLWRVNDAASSGLMQEFYKSMKDGDDVFTSLQAAQKRMITRGIGPALWGGYIPFGESTALSN